MFLFFRCGKTPQNACFSLWFATFGASNIAKSALAFHSWKRMARAVGQNYHFLEAKKMIALLLRNYFTFRNIKKVVNVYIWILLDCLIDDELTS